MCTIEDLRRHAREAWLDAERMREEAPWFATLRQRDAQTLLGWLKDLEAADDNGYTSIIARRLGGGRVKAGERA